MGLWSEHLFPRCAAWGMRGEQFSALRREVLRDVSGRVLELGFGAGLNLPHYRAAETDAEPGVSELLVIEPLAINRRLAARRVAASPFPVRWVGLRGEEIPLESGSVDCVTSTWTLCSIADLGAALAEVRRVLRPRGRLFFLEHGLSPDPKVAARQNRWNGLQKRLAGGCHLNRPIDTLVRSAGFAIERLDHPPMKGPRVASYLYRGSARPATGGAETELPLLDLDRSR